MLRGPLFRSLTRSFATLQPRQGGQSAYSPVPPSLPGTASPCQADSPVLPAKASSSVGRNPWSVAKGSSPSAYEGSFRVLQKSVTVQGWAGGGPGRAEVLYNDFWYCSFQGHFGFLQGGITVRTVTPACDRQARQEAEELQDALSGTSCRSSCGRPRLAVTEGVQTREDGTAGQRASGQAFRCPQVRGDPPPTHAGKTPAQL